MNKKPIKHSETIIYKQTSVKLRKEKKSPDKALLEDSNNKKNLSTVGHEG